MILRLLAAFLIGSLPFSYWLGRLLGKDLRREGSKNPGATNLYRVCGPGPGLTGLALDIAKGVLGAGLGAGEPWLGPLCALAAILGHVYTPFLGFRGGKGVATAAGAFGLLAPGPLAWALACFALSLALTRYVALASSMAALGLSVSALILPIAALVRVTCLLISLIVLFRHRANFKRLLEGTEPKFKFTR